MPDRTSASWNVGVGLWVERDIWLVQEGSKRDPMILVFILECLKWFGQIMTILSSVLILQTRKPLRETTPHCSAEGAESLWDVSRNLFWKAALLALAAFPLRGFYSLPPAARTTSLCPLYGLHPSYTLWASHFYSLISWQT